MARKSESEYLEEARRLARLRGGRLLSAAYRGDTGKLRFRCAAGHLVRQTPGGLKQGKWCFTCGRILTGEKLRAKAFARLGRIVARRGGVLLTRRYVNAQTKLQIRCARGHTWRVVPFRVLQGAWCPRCAREPRLEARRGRVYARLERVARRHGGRILSPSLADYRRPLRVRCAEGHTWDEMPQQLDQGAWCHRCEDARAFEALGRRVVLLAGGWRAAAFQDVKEPRHAGAGSGRDSADRHLTQLRRIALARGGRLLSDRYVDDRTKLRFRCAEGHEWLHTPSGIKQGRWCGPCGVARRAAKHRAPAMARFYRIVEEKGGAVLSPAYVNSQTPIRLRCAQGHEWSPVPNTVLQGRWCRFCANEYRKQHQHAERKRRVLRRLIRKTAQFGARVVSEFVDSKTPLRFRCDKGHRWEALAASIDHGGRCPVCKEAERMASLRALAGRWGGECLSTTCRTVRDVLDWRCAEGHRFRSTATRILRGGWCRRCRSYVRGDIERMRRMAAERGGKCLSENYVGAVVKLRWRCRQGHEWAANAADVVQGHWCPECARWSGYSRRRLSIEDVRTTASERGGECLSKTYHGSKVRLRWRCARGHTWSALPSRVRQGAWCPSCAHSIPGTLEGMRALAIGRGGRCLSRSWLNHQRALHFVCARGHRFHALASALRTGVWCPECRR